MAYPMSMLSIEVAAAIPKNKISEMVDNVLAQEAKPADKTTKFAKKKIPPDIITAFTKVSPNTESQDYLNQDEADTNVEYAKGRAHDQAGVGAVQVQGGEGRRALVQAGGSHDTPQRPRWGNSRTKKYQEEQGFVRMLYPGRSSVEDHHWHSWVPLQSLQDHLHPQKDHNFAQLPKHQDHHQLLHSPQSKWPSEIVEAVAEQTDVRGAVKGQAPGVQDLSGGEDDLQDRGGVGVWRSGPGRRSRRNVKYSS